MAEVIQLPRRDLEATLREIISDGPARVAFVLYFATLEDGLDNRAQRRFLLKLADTLRSYMEP